MLPVPVTVTVTAAVPVSVPVPVPVPVPATVPVPVPVTGLGGRVLHAEPPPLATNNNSNAMSQSQPLLQLPPLPLSVHLDDASHTPVTATMGLSPQPASQALRPPPTSTISDPTMVPASASASATSQPPIPLTGPVPPLVWSTRHRERLVMHGYPSAIPFQGVSHVIGVTNVPDPTSLDGARAAHRAAATKVGQRHKRTALGNALLGVPDLDLATRVDAPARPRATAAGAQQMDRAHTPKSGLPPPATPNPAQAAAPWRLVPHKWLYRGRPRILLTAHDQRAFGFTLFLIILLPGLYYGFVALAVWTDLGMPWAVGLSIWLHVTAFAALLMTSFSDPGILPTFTHLHFDRSTLDPAGRPDTLVIPRVLDPDPYDYTYRDLGFQVKYCSTCKIYRGPRTFHCSICDACIAHHDHHCPYTSNCIGRGNYRYFVTFLSHALAVDVLVGVLCVLVLVHAASASSPPTPPEVGQDLAATVTAASSVTRAFNQHPLALFLAIACGLLCFTLVPLTSYHWYLSLLNMTTHEHMRYGPDPNWRNPWRHPGWIVGPWRNLVEALCRPLPRQNLVWYRPADVLMRDEDGAGPV